jgi:hypothetical protein
METVRLGKLEVSRFIIGSNPFSGFSHQSIEMNLRMKRWWTVARIKGVLGEAERLGVNAVIARADHHIMRLLLEYWDEGGRLQWLAQTCPEVGPTELSVQRAIAGGARACHVHGGVTDYLLAQGRLREVQDDLKRIRDGGLLAGLAGHNPRVFEFAEEHLDVDYYMCSYYNPTRRDKNPEHPHGAEERFAEEDRQRVVKLIAGLSRPAIHYKVLAAGRNDPAAAFAVVARALRPNDAVCVGVYTEMTPDMLQRDAQLFEQSLVAARAAK